MEPNKTIPTEKLQAKKLTRKEIIIAIIIFIFVCLGTITFLKIREANLHARLRVIGKYRVIADTAYFFDDADKNTKREEFLLSADTITAYKRKGDFIYTEMEGVTGELQSGWLKKKDVITEKDWLKKYKTLPPLLEEIIQTKQQLHSAKQFLESKKTVEALVIYSNLSNAGIPEAMYEYAVLALKNINRNISCSEAFELLQKAADENYLPAKYTLGYLYAFGNDERFLGNIGFVIKCSFSKNLDSAKLFLSDASTKGDTAANNLLKQISGK